MTNLSDQDLRDLKFEHEEDDSDSMKITTSQDVIAGLHAEIDRLKWENVRLSALVESLTEALSNDK